MCFGPQVARAGKRRSARARKKLARAEAALHPYGRAAPGVHAARSACGGSFKSLENPTKEFFEPQIFVPRALRATCTRHAARDLRPIALTAARNQRMAGACVGREQAQRNGFLICPVKYE
jgi:hypothetical protein